MRPAALDDAGVPAPYPFGGRPGVAGPGTPAV